MRGESRQRPGEDAGRGPRLPGGSYPPIVAATLADVRLVGHTVGSRVSRRTGHPIDREDPLGMMIPLLNM
jgi:hypothetical protein